MNPDGVRDYDLLVPASRRGARRRAPRRRPRRVRAGGRDLARGVHRASTAVIRAAQPTREGAAPADDGRARSGSTARWSARSGRGSSSSLGVGPDDTEAIAGDLARKAAELRIFRDEDGPDEPVAARHRRRGARRLAVHAVRRHAPRSPAGVHGCRAARARRAALPAVRGRAPARSASRGDRAGSVPRWRSSSSTTARSRSGSTPRSASGQRRYCRHGKT